jgi:hypothetical protein
MIWKKNCLIYKPEREAAWWRSHAMAPAALLYNEQTIRVFMGCWDENGIARIGYIDIQLDEPKTILRVSEQPVLDIGRPGCFDDNGVFPGHVYEHQGIVYLYYTGFQKLDRIPFTNFCGLAISKDGGDTFVRVSEAPVMDRSDEGLFTRAGTSIVVEDGIFRSCYCAGSSWVTVAGKARPVYEVYYTESSNGIDFDRRGRCIVKCDLSVEHGLGRPQLTKIEDSYYVFYTRRLLDYRYHMGVAKSSNLVDWQRMDDLLAPIAHGGKGDFDGDMVYFPCVLQCKKKLLLFYSGNGYGRGGFGYAEASV